MGFCGLPGFTGANSNNQSLAIDKNGFPYLAYNDGSVSSITAVAKFNGTNWEFVGSPGFTTNAYSHNSLAIDNNGKLYLASINLATLKATVFTFNGSNWVETIVSDGDADYTSLAIDANGIPFIAYQDKANGSKLTVKKFNGTNWVAVGSVGVSSGAVAYVDLEFSNTNEPHVVFQDKANSNGTSVMKYAGSSWQLVGNADLSNNGFGYLGTEQQSITFDKNNTCFVASIVYSTAGLASIQVKKFNSVSWVSAGATFIANSRNSTDIVFNGNESMLVAFNEFYNNTGFVYELDYFNPTVTKISPLDNTENVPLNANLEITFSENIIKNASPNSTYNHLDLYDADSGNLIQAIDISSSSVTINGNKATIQLPANLLEYKTSYFATLDGNTFTDSFGNGSSSISGSTFWNFKTLVDPSSIDVGLELWFKADKGVTANSSSLVSSWSDQSINSKNATIAVNSPLNIENSINFNPAIYFNDGLNEYFNIDIESIKNSDYTLIVIAKRSSSKAQSYLLGTNSFGNNQGLHFGYRANTTFTLGQYANDINLSVKGFDNPQELPVLIRGQLDQTVGRLTSELKDGVLLTQTETNRVPLTGTATGTLGKYQGDGFEGYISEVMIYSKALSSPEIRKIYSYLAIKYGLSLENSAGGIDGDYVASDGTTIFWDASGNSDYHNNITAIAKDEVTGLNQIKSKSSNSTGILTIEKPANFTADKKAIIMGSDTGDLSYSAYNKYGLNNYTTLNKSWKLQTNVGNPLNEKIKIEIEIPNTGKASDYLLLTEIDASYSYEPVSINGNTISFANVLPIDGKIYRLLKKYPEAPTTTKNTQIFVGNTGTLADLEVDGTNIKWYTASQNGSELLLSTILTDQTTYYASQTFSGFESTNRLAIKAHKISEAKQFIASTGNITDLVVANISGTTVAWYNAPTGGSPLTVNDILQNGATYYVEQTQTTPLEISKRFAVIIEFTSEPPVGLASQIFTGNNKTLADLQVTGVNIKWYAVATGGSELPLSTTLTDETTYYASQKPSGLEESANRFAVSVKKITDATISILPQSKIANLTTTPSVGYNVKWFSAASGGVELPITDLLVNNTTYYAQQEATDVVSTLANISPIIPNDITISNTNKIFFVGKNTNAVYKMDINGGNLTKVKDGFNNPSGIALDASGRIYIANTGSSNIIRINADGTNQVTLGTGFNGPVGVTVDSSGNIFVADSGNNAIKRMNASGNNIVNLGNGFNRPTDVSVDASGNIYVADYRNFRVKKMDPNGGNIISLPGVYKAPYRIKIDTSDNIYVADLTYNYIYKINLTTIINTVYRNLNNPLGLALDTNNNIFVALADDKIIKRIGSEVSNRVPVLIKIASKAPVAITTQIYSGDDKTLADIAIQGNNIKWYTSLSDNTELPLSTALVDDKTYYVSQITTGFGESYSRLAITVNRVSNDVIRVLADSKISDLNLSLSPTATVKVFDNITDTTPIEITAALEMKTYYVEQEIPSAVSQVIDGLAYAGDVFIDNFGNIFYTDIGRSQIVKINASDNSAAVLGSGFRNPIGVHVDDLGNIYIADTNNNAVKKMNAAGTVITVLASGINKPHGIFVTTSGDVYFSERDNNAVKRINANDNSIVTLGSGFVQPAGVFVDASNAIFVADRGNNVIKKMDINGNNIVSLGSGFNQPTGVFVDDLGEIYIADNANNVIKKMNADGSNIETLAGGFNKPENLHVDDLGNVYLGNGANRTINKIVAPIISNKILINVELLSSAPTGTAFQLFAGDDKTLADLEITGTDIKWYDATSDGTELPSTTILEDNKTYYASQKTNGLEESIARFSIRVKRIVDGKVIREIGSKIESIPLFTSGGNTGKIYESLTSTRALLPSTILTNTTYYAAQEPNVATSVNTILSRENGIAAIALDALGNIYYTTLASKEVKKINISDNTTSVLASGLNRSWGIAIDNLGRVLYTDQTDNNIKRINTDGSIVTLASGLSNPFGIDVHSNGDIYFALRGSSNSVAKMNDDGTDIVTVATGFNRPADLFIDDYDNIYVADVIDNVIKKMDSNGSNIISLGAGFKFSSGVVVDKFGKIYVADVMNNAIKRMDSDGSNIITVANGFRVGYLLDLDVSGNIFVTDAGAGTITKINAPIPSTRIQFNVELASDELTAKTTQVFSGDTKTVADLNITGNNIKWYNAEVEGSEIPNTTILQDDAIYYASQNTTGLKESLNRLPIKVNRVSDAVQNISTGITANNLTSTPLANTTVEWYVNNSDNTLLNSSDNLSETTYYATQKSTPSMASLASGFSQIYDVAVDDLGNIYVADYNYAGIRKLDAQGNLIEKIANGLTGIVAIEVDNGGQLYFAQHNQSAIKRINTDGTNLVTLATGFTNLYDLALSKDGYIYVVEGQNCIQRINIDGTNKIAIACGFSRNMFGITLDNKGSIYVATGVNTGITKMTVSGTNRVVLGSGIVQPRDVVIGKDGSIYVSDGTGGNVIYKMDKNGANKQAIATGQNFPLGIALDFQENIYVANFNSKDIKKIQQESLSNKTPVSVEFLNNFTATNGNWSADANWSLGRKPVTTDDVVVLSGKTSAQDIGNLEVDNFINLGTTNFSKTDNIIVNKDFTNSGDLTINSDETESGVLLINGNANGDISYKRGGLLANKWSVLSSPVKNQKILEFAQNNANDLRINATVTPNRYAVANYNPNSSVTTSWGYFTTNTSSSLVFEVATGYSISRNTDGEVTFKGTLEVGGINKNMIGNEWNAVGNPYTTYYPINKNAENSFLNDNLSNLGTPAVYIWDKTQEKYKAITNLITSDEQFLTPGQGFFVKSEKATSVNFNKDKRSVKPANGNHNFNKTSSKVPYIRLFAQKNDIVVNTAIIYSETASKGFDKSEDIENFESANFDVNSHLVENSDGKNYTIQSLLFSEIENSIIPISFKGQKNDKVLFTVATKDFPTGIRIYIEDKLKNTFSVIDEENNIYKITLTENMDNIGRFYLHTSAKSLSTQPNILQGVNLFKYNNSTLKITGLLNQNAVVEIYDILGKQVLETSFLGKMSTEIKLPDLKQAIYLVKLSSEKGVLTKKIIIN